MALSEASGSESPRDASTPSPPGGGTDSTGDRTTRRIPTSIVSAPERERVIKQTRATEFPVALRGYDRGAVDRYVEHVNRLLAELEISSSPESAVRHAHDTAEEITARSRSRADDRLVQAEQEGKELRAVAQREAEETREAALREAEETREAARREAAVVRETAQRESQELRDTAQREVSELRETAASETAEMRESAKRESQQLRSAAQRDAEELRSAARNESEEMLEYAQTRTRELARSAETIWRERRRLIDDMRGIGEQLVAIGDVEGKRFAKLTDEIPSAADQPATPAHNGEPAAAT